MLVHHDTSLMLVDVCGSAHSHYYGRRRRTYLSLWTRIVALMHASLALATPSGAR